MTDAKIFRIGDVAKRVGCSPTFIREAEKRGLIDTAAKDFAGQRRYDQKEVARITEALAPLSRSK